MAVLMKYNPLTGKLDFTLDPSTPGISHADIDDLVAPADDHTQYALLAGRNGGQILRGGTLTTQTLTLRDNVVDGTGLVLGSTGLLPETDGVINLGAEGANFQTLYLSGESVENVIIKAPDCFETGAQTAYIMDLGGGFYGSGLGGGDFTFRFSSAVGGGENFCLFDLGAVYYAGGPTLSNDIAFMAYNGLSYLRFLAKFGGFSNPEYGWALDRIPDLAEPSAKTLFFDNADSQDHPLRSIDFRIAGVNVLTIENAISSPPASVTPATVDFPLRHVSAPGDGLVINKYMTMSSSTVFNLYDVFTLKPVGPYSGTGNVGGVFALRPIGTANPGDTVANLCCNDEDANNYGAFENSLAGQIARLACWDIGTGLSATELRIGEMASAFFGVGADTALLTTIDFYFANAIEMQIQPNLLIFNNGAVDTQIDWATSGELGLQVALADIIRINATQARILQDLVIPSDTKKIFLGASDDMSMEYDGTRMLIDVSLQNPSDIDIDCGTDKTVRMVETVWDDLRVPGLAVEATGPNPPTLGAFLGAGGLQAWRFTGTGPNVNEVWFTVQLPHTYKEGTDIYPHVHWTPTDANAGDVVWQLEYTWVNINGTFPASATITVTDSTNTTAWEHLVAPFAAITGTGKTISSMLVCRLFRDPTHLSDTYGFDASLLEIDFHFEVETLGSRQEYVK